MNISPERTLYARLIRLSLPKPFFTMRSVQTTRNSFSAKLYCGPTIQVRWPDFSRCLGITSSPHILLLPNLRPAVTTRNLALLLWYPHCSLNGSYPTERKYAAIVSLWLANTHLPGSFRLTYGQIPQGACRARHFHKSSILLAYTRARCASCNRARLGAETVLPVCRAHRSSDPRQTGLD